MFLDFLAILATIKKQGNEVSGANSDQESDVSEVSANKAFLKKNLESKSDSKSNKLLDDKSEDKKSEHNKSANNKSKDNKNNFRITSFQVP